MNSPETPVREATSAFAPLPLRPRGPIEILDVGVRVYKQYFWTLFSWSALVTMLSVVVAFVPGGSMVAIGLEPLVVGASVCSLAAAVRGQQLTFKQAGEFSKSRFWPMVGMYLLSMLIMILAVVAVAAIIGLCVAGMWNVVSTTSGLVMAVILGIVVGSVVLFVFSCLAIWSMFVEIVVAMEDDKRSTVALRRAYDLLSGHWVRVSVLVLLVGLGCLVLFAIIGVAGLMLVGVGSLKDLVMGNSSSMGMVWGMMAVWVIAISLIQTLFKPFYYTTLTLFYLDIRIRKEALDLEWTAHTTTPQEALTAGRNAPNVWSPDTPGGLGSFVGLPAGAAASSGAPNTWYDAVPAGQAPPVPNLHGAPPAPIAPRLICSHCGASVPASDTCSNCGSLLPVTAAPSAAPLVNTTTPDDWTRANTARLPEDLAPSDTAPAPPPNDTTQPPQTWNDSTTPQP